MVGLGGLEPPTSPLSVLGPGSRSVILRNAGRLANPKLILWRELPEQGDEALQKSNKRWLVLGLRPKEHDSRMGFWRYAWTFVSEAVSDWAILAVHLGPPLSLLSRISERSSP